MESDIARLFIQKPDGGLNAKIGVQDIAKTRSRGSPLVTGKIQLPGNSDGDVALDANVV